MAGAVFAGVRELFAGIGTAGSAETDRKRPQGAARLRSIILPPVSRSDEALRARCGRRHKFVAPCASACTRLGSREASQGERIITPAYGEELQLS